MFKSGFMDTMNMTVGEKVEDHTYPVPLNARQLNTIIKLTDLPIFDVQTSRFFGRHISNVSIKISSRGRVAGRVDLDLPEEEEYSGWKNDISDNARPWFLGFGIIPYRILRRCGRLFPAICNFNEVKGSFMCICVGVNNTVYPPKNEYFWKTIRNGPFTREHPRSRMFKYDSSVYFFEGNKGYLPSVDGTLNSMLSRFIPDFMALQSARQIRAVREHDKLTNHGYIEETPPRSQDEIKWMKELRTMRIERVRVTGDARYEKNGVGMSSERVHDEDMDDDYVPVSDFYPQEGGGYGNLVKLRIGEKFKARSLAPMETDVESIKTTFNRMFSAALAGSQQPWGDNTQFRKTEQEIIETQQFDMMKAKNELAIYSRLVKEWYLRTHGHKYLCALMGNHMLKRGVKLYPKKVVQLKRLICRAAKLSVRDASLCPLTDEEMFILWNEGNITIDVFFERSSYIVRPDVENLSKFYLAGMISDERFAKINSDLYGVEMSPVSMQKFFRGTVMATGELEPHAKSNLEIRKETKMAELQNKLMRDAHLHKLYASKGINPGKAAERSLNKNGKL